MKLFIVVKYTLVLVEVEYRGKVINNLDQNEK